MRMLSPAFSVPSAPRPRLKHDELVLRMADMARRLKPDELAVVLNDMALKVAPDDVVVDLTKRTAVRRGVTVRLTNNYASFLYRLCLSFPAVVPLEDLAVAVYGGLGRTEKNYQSIRVMVRKLRPRLEDLSAFIENKHGVGYRLALAPV